jgi:NADP-dependent aldehyde dehydrogenase
MPGSAGSCEVSHPTSIRAGSGKHDYDAEVSGADQGVNPYTGEPVGAAVPHTPPSEVDQLGTAARQAAHQLAAMPLPHRAELLRGIAAALEEARDELVALADAETGLGPARLGGELTRAQAQFELFAGVVDEGSFLQVVVDHADPAARPAARPDLRRMLVPIGPVAVFAASNFPFAFSVAGGDTASALAAGCPVIVKAHPGHPALSARCGELIAAAVAHHGAPAGTFALVYGIDAGLDLVRHPAVAAVGFTGSIPGGRALFDVAQSRPDPIPFYGELGSLNPTVVTPGALAERGDAIAAGFVASFTLGSGQFCTKPGLLFLPAGHGLTETLATQVGAAGVGPLLNARIHDGYTSGVAGFAADPGVRAIVAPSTVDGVGYAVAPTLFAVPAPDLNEGLLDECFGPTALVVEYASTAELAAALDAVPGSLTATLHADPVTEPDLIRALLAQVSAKAGRVVWDAWPTGVAVTDAQHHGGPWPATTAARTTSVGTAAIDRFLRPVAYQNLPDVLLPPALQEANPLGLPRRVDGVNHSGHTGQSQTSP